MTALLALTASQLRSLIEALEEGRLVRPVSALAVARLVAGAPNELTAELDVLLERSGAGGAALALKLMVQARGERESSVPELVWSGPDESHQTRDTGVVVRELFAQAEREVVLSGFVVVDGSEIFRLLAERLDSLPALEVRLFLNVQADETRSDEARLMAFARDFANRQWPGHRLPKVFYDPRAFSERRADRAALHAKCVVVDRKLALVTSANFTPHAQRRNVELGVLLRDELLAARIAEQFEGLVDHGHFVLLPPV